MSKGGRESERACKRTKDAARQFNCARKHMLYTWSGREGERGSRVGEERGWMPLFLLLNYLRTQHR